MGEEIINSYKTNNAEVCTTGFRAYEAPLTEQNASGYGGNAAASGDDGNAAASGYGGNAAASGYGGNAAASGARGNAAASGYGGNAAASGYGGNAAASGVRGSAIASGALGLASADGEQCIAVAWGAKCRARGDVGCWIVVTEYNEAGSIEAGSIIDAKMAKIDGNHYKPNVWYTLKDGNIVEVEEENNDA